MNGMSFKPGDLVMTRSGFCDFLALVLCVNDDNTVKGLILSSIRHWSPGVFPIGMIVNLDDTDNSIPLFLIGR